MEYFFPCRWDSLGVTQNGGRVIVRVAKLVWKTLFGCMEHYAVMFDVAFVESLFFLHSVFLVPGVELYS